MTYVNTKVDKPEQTVELCYGEKDGTLLHISEVVSGLECGCICPACAAPLIARKGEIRKHHYAHHQGTDDKSCLETALHRYAKQVLANEKKLFLPDIYLHGYLVDEIGNRHERHQLEKGVLRQLTTVTLEVQRDSYRADVVGYIEEFGELDVEIRVTHEVDSEKQEKVRSLRKSMVEIDISELPRDATPDEIKEAVLYTAPREWIYNQLTGRKAAELEGEIIDAVQHSNSKLKALSEREKLTLDSSSRDTMFLLGYTVGNGTKKATGEPFETAQLCRAKPRNTFSSSFYSVTDCGGYDVEMIDFDETLLEKLEAFTYPVEVRATVDIQNSFRRKRLVVTDVEPLSL